MAGVSRLPGPEDLETDAILSLLGCADRVGVECLGMSRAGRRIPLLTIGDGPSSALIVGAPHPNEPTGCLTILRMLDRLVGRGFVAGRVADIGCGTAVLALAAARVWRDAVVLAGDIDPVAVEVARANLAANGMTDRVTCIEAAGFEHGELAQAAPYDLVFANILKGPLVALAPDIVSRMRAGGYAILSGILNEQAADVAEVYARSGINEVERARIGDWTTLLLQKSA